jgi:hypothetical protein
MLYLAAFICLLTFIIAIFIIHIQVNSFEKKVNDLVKAIEDHIYISE